ncbi:zf-HC2 domain-containing protein [bacterium]|nr:zf-HC2 domain-containing protein [bacterium]
MNKDLNCSQVSALINFYLEGKLNPRLREYVNNHLSKCSKCKEKIDKLQKILNKFRHNAIQHKEYNENNYEYMHKLSAYVDNELNTDENIKIKKMTISNPKARKELETLYKFQNVIHSAYEKTKNDSKFDYSKNIITKLQDGTEYTTTYFYKLATLFVILITGIISCFIYLYFN